MQIDLSAVYNVASSPNQSLRGDDRTIAQKLVSSEWLIPAMLISLLITTWRKGRKS